MFLRFLGQVSATIIGLFIFSFLAILTLFGIIAVASSGASDAAVQIEDKTVLTLDINEVDNDYAGKFQYNGLAFNDEEKDGFIDVLNALDKAKTDSKIKGISILNSNLSLGMAQCKSLRDKLIEFKKSGKFIVAYSDTYSQKDYYVNSVADTLYLNPVGELDLKGLATEVLYFKDFQEKYGVKMEIIRHGKYKSAVEPFLADKMSPENKEQISRILTNIWNVVVTDISKSRKKTVADLNAIAENLAAKTPEKALQLQLIDKIAYEDKYHDGIKKALALPLDEDYKTVSVLDYAKTNKVNTSATNSIAVVYAQGVILGGEGDDTYIGEQSIKRALGDARKNQDIKAVVLRVDSPGGSALTSELIWREVQLTRKTKPVIVSMGNTAASGGYYIACGADHIFAESNTITGSIGVFGQLPNLAKLTSDMGIKTELVQTHSNAEKYSPFRPLNDNIKNDFTKSIETIYTTFVQRVATGRKMTFAQVDAIAQGRVWTGNDAVSIGLVDTIGNLDDAIAYAVKTTKTGAYKVVNYPEYKIDFRNYLNGLIGMSVFESKESLLRSELGEENYQILKQIRVVNARKGVQMVLPYELKIQ